MNSPEDATGSRRPPRSLRGQVRRELEFHLEMKQRELRERGLSESRARREALRAFGDPARIARQCRRASRRRFDPLEWLQMLDSIVHDLRFALVGLRKNPLLATVAVVTLALGIGANTALLSLFDQILVQALPVRAPEELVNLAAPGPKPGSTSCNQAGTCEEVFSYPMFRDLERAPGPFAGLAGHRPFGANLAYRGETIAGSGTLVSGSYFPLLGVRPALGRLLGPDDDVHIGERFVAVLSYGYWQNRLGADPDVLNDTIVINGKPYTIVGVTERGFRGTTLGARPDVFVPLSMRGEISPGWEGFDDRRTYWVYVFGRLRPGVTIEQAAQELNASYSAILADVEAPLQTGMSEATMQRFLARRVLIEPGARGQSFLHEEAREPLVMLVVIAAIVLLIACANIANLLLARGTARSAEMAIRGSLGASRAQLVRQLLAEALVLAAAGGVASLLVARWTLSGLASVLPAYVVQTLTFDLRPGTLAFAGALSLVTGVLFGLYPALHATRAGLAVVLRTEAGRSLGSRFAYRFRRGLVVAQLALSTTLLVTAGLFLQSLNNLARVDLGLHAQNVVAFTVSPSLNGYDSERAHELYRGLEERIATLPGVSGVTASMVPVLAGDTWGITVSVEGIEWDPDRDMNSRFNGVGPGYFVTLGIPLIAGREFTSDDDGKAPKVAIVNEAFTRKFGLGGAGAVGKRIAQGGGPEVELDVEIVGVVRDAKYQDVREEVPPQLFRPYRQMTIPGSLTFYARAERDPDAVMRAIRPLVAEFDPNLPVEDLRTLQQNIDDNLVMDRVIGTISSAFALLATLLAAVGLYGVLAYTVAQRTREIGVRMALGADRRGVRALVLRQVAGMIAVGGTLGLLGAVGLGRAARSLLYGVGGQDPTVLAGSGLALVAVALAAAYVPVRRASRVDPVQALRAE